MTRATRLLPSISVAVAAIVVVVSASLARPHGSGMHHGVPAAIVSDRSVGPYLASVWADADVGASSVYVVLRSERGPYIAPTSVRVALQPASARAAGVTVAAHLQDGTKPDVARYMAHVTFDREEQVNLRVFIEGSAGGGEVSAQLHSRVSASDGPIGLVLSTVPFLLAALVWWRVTAVRRRMSATYSALT